MILLTTVRVTAMQVTCTFAMSRLCTGMDPEPHTVLSRVYLQLCENTFRCRVFDYIRSTIVCWTYIGNAARCIVLFAHRPAWRRFCTIDKYAAIDETSTYRAVLSVFANIKRSFNRNPKIVS